jgi:hypothetical protein
MGLYLGILAFLFVLFSLSLIPMPKTGSLLLMILGLSSMTLTSGLRSPEVGTDSLMYQTIYDHLADGWQYCPVEKGYCAINRFFVGFGLPFQIVFLVESIVIYTAIGIFCYFIISRKDWMFICLLVYVTQIFFAAMNVSRQYFAIAFCLIAYVCYIKKHAAFAFCFVALAFSMHMTAVIVLLLPVIVFLSKSRYFVLLTIIGYVLSLLVRVVGPSSFFGIFLSLIPKYAHYAYDSTFQQTATPIYTILSTVVPNVLFVIIFSILAKRLNRAQVEDDFLYEQELKLRLAISGSVLYIILLNAFSGVMALVRFADYFIFFMFLGLSLSLQKQDKKISFATQYFVVLAYGIICLYLVFVKGNYEVIPYTFGNWA